MYTFKEVSIALDGGLLSDAIYKLQRFAEAQGLSELAEWTTLEQSGYLNNADKEAEDEAREYRSAAVQWRDIYNRPVTVDPRVSFANNLPLWFGVIDLEGFAENGTGYLPKSAIAVLQKISDVPLSGVWIAPEQIQAILSRIRFEARRRLHDSVPRTPTQKLSYPSPNFGILVSNSDMAKILGERWVEANVAFEAGAFRSTIIMLGSILEGVLLSKMEQNPVIANAAASTPTDRRTGHPLVFSAWTLETLIKVAFECHWLKKDARDFSHTVRDYRNFVHPNKERTEGITLSASTCRVVFEVVTSALEV